MYKNNLGKIIINHKYKNQYEVYKLKFIQLKNLKEYIY